jgi:hypothetical protein
MTDELSTFEVGQPWVLYHYGQTHDRWWPLWTSTHVLGRARIRMECIVCGHAETASIKIPRFGRVPTPQGDGRHPVRKAFLAAHAHPDRGAPMSWAKPLANMEAHPGGLNLDALAMRIEADLTRDINKDTDT